MKFGNIFSCRVFPWIIEVFDMRSYYFYKVIEVLVRVEDGLSRDVVKHLNHVSYARFLWFVV